MRSLLLSLVLIFGMGPLNQALGAQVAERSEEAALNNVDAVRAVAIANEWRWSKKDIKSYVTTREVVFQFPDGRVKKIPLPENQMLVAVAPYINNTHT
jgi:hypothetical protein